MRLSFLKCLLSTLFLFWVVPSFAQSRLPGAEAIDAEVRGAMARTHANGLAIAVIDGGRWGIRGLMGFAMPRASPLTSDTVMYGASLTKMVFAYHVMQLVDEGKLGLDTPFRDDFERPLIEYGAHSDQAFLRKYGPYTDLAGDARWERLTPRMSLTHSTGFANFWVYRAGAEAADPL